MFVTWNQSQQIWKHLKKVFTANGYPKHLWNTPSDIPLQGTNRLNRRRHQRTKRNSYSPLCQRSERKDRAHLLPPGRQGDLQARTHSEAILDEGKDHDAGGEEKRGDLQGPLCRLKLRVCWRDRTVTRGEIERT